MTNKTIANAKAANQAEPKTPKSGKSLILDNISPHLIVTIQTCDDGGAILDGGIVRGMFTEGEKTIESQWQSPFENMSPESRMPALLAGLQSGTLSDAFKATEIGKAALDMTGGGKVLDGLKGKSNFSRVNSIQTFVGTHSVKMSLTLFFMAVEDANEEVEQQIKLLEKWTLPQRLTRFGMIVNAAKMAESTEESTEDDDGLFGTKVPPFVAISLHGRTYAPFIIESVTAPMKVPIDKNGHRLSASVNLSVVSRAAWDAKDIDKFYQ